MYKTLYRSDGKGFAKSQGLWLAYLLLKVRRKERRTGAEPELKVFLRWINRRCN